MAQENSFSQYITVGQLAKPFGLQGEIKAWPATHDPERCQQLGTVYLQLSEKDIREMQVEYAHCRGDGWILKFTGINSPEAVREFGGAQILIPPQERLPLPPGQYYFSDLEGLGAIDEKGTQRATVLRVEEHPSVNVFVLQMPDREILAPWIDDCIGEIDLNRRTVCVNFSYLSELDG